MSKLRQKLTEGERRVLELFLSTLSEDWEIYVQPHLNGLRPDFVVMNPAVGIGVFEVKDWDLQAMTYYTRPSLAGKSELMGRRDGTDFSLHAQNPVRKASRYKQEIFDLYCPRLKQGNGWAAITAGVIFPFAARSAVNALLAPFLPKPDDKVANHYQPVAGAEDVASGRIAVVFPEATRRSSRIMSAQLADDLRGWLTEPDFAAEQRLPLVLDRNQSTLAESRTKSGYRRIRGPAGSGKSLVLAARAARLADEDKRVLVATYNITLWHYLRDLIVRGISDPGKFDNVTFVHFHKWCRDECERNGFEERYLGLAHSAMEDRSARGDLRKRIIEIEIPNLTATAIEAGNADAYDAILVDEGQDYRPHWWSLLMKARAEDGEVLMVADATQDVYGTSKSWTDDVMVGAGFEGRWAQLGTSYRMPPEAIQFARRFAEQFLPVGTTDLPIPEQGSLDLHPCRLRWVQCDPGDTGMVGAVEVVRMLRDTGAATKAANADITVLAADMEAGTRIVAELGRHRINVADTFGTDHRRKKMAFWMGDARIKATTLHSFKRWETRLLVVQVSQAAHAQSLALVYAGLTRLKRSEHGSWLTVVCSAPELEGFGKTFPEHVDHNAVRELTKA